MPYDPREAEAQRAAIEAAQRAQEEHFAFMRAELRKQQATDEYYRRLEQERRREQAEQERQKKEKMRAEAEAKSRAEAKDRARREAEAKAKKEADAAARRDAEKKAQLAADASHKLDSEAKRKAKSGQATRPANETKVHATPRSRRNGSLGLKSHERRDTPSAAESRQTTIARSQDRPSIGHTAEGEPFFKPIRFRWQMFVLGGVAAAIWAGVTGARGIELWSVALLGGLVSGVALSLLHRAFKIVQLILMIGVVIAVLIAMLALSIWLLTKY